jgi:hypothetical protein
MGNNKITCNRYTDGVDEQYQCAECAHSQNGESCGQQNCWHSCTVCEYNNMKKECEEQWGK